MSDQLLPWVESCWGLLAILLIASTFICVIIWLLNSFLRVSAADRFSFWKMAIVGLLLVPVGTTLLPKVPLGWFASHRIESSTRVETILSGRELCEAENQRSLFDQRIATSPPVAAEYTYWNQPPGSVVQSPQPSIDAQQPPLLVQTSTPPRQVRAAFTRLPWSTIFVAIWLFGVSLMIARVSISWFKTHTITRRATPFDAAHDARAIPILISDELAFPVTTGIAKPKVILPKDARSWPLKRLRMIIKHETAHIERRDVAWQLLTACVRCLYWFQPLLWIADRKMQLEREKACDDRVLAQGEEPSDYATMLLQIAAELSGRQRNLWGAIPIARKPIESRLATILEPLTPRSAARLPVRAAIAIAFGALAVSMCTIRPFDQPVPSSETETSTEVITDPEPQDRQADDSSVQESEASIKLPDQLTGQVFDGEGDPIEGAQVALVARRIREDGLSIDVSADVHLEHTETDSQGKFTIATPDLEMRTSRMQISGKISAKGYLDKNYYHSVTSRNNNGLLDGAKLIAARRVTGQLVAAGKADSNPEKLVQATVQFCSAGNGTSWFGSYIACDDDGHFDAWVPRDGVVEMVTRSENFCGVRVDVPSETQDLGEIEMPGGTSVSGQVFDESGEPAPDVVVTIYSLEFNESSKVYEHHLKFPIQHSVLTAMDGSFEFPPMQGECKVILEQSGRDASGKKIRSREYPPIILPRLINLEAGKDRFELKLTPAPTFTVRGVMAFSDGTPAANVPLKGHIMFFGSGERISYATTDDKGKYKICLPKCEHNTSIVAGHIIAKSGQWNWAYPKLVGLPGVTTQHDTQSVHFKSPIEVNVDNINWEVRERDKSAAPDQQDDQSEEEAAGKPQETVALPSTIVGKVLDHDKQPLADAEVTLTFHGAARVNPGQIDPKTQHTLQATTDAEGRYEIDTRGVRLSGYRYAGIGIVEATDRPLAIVPYIPVPVDDQLQMPDVVFHEGRKVTGRVLAETDDGESPVNSTIRMVGQSVLRTTFTGTDDTMPYWFSNTIVCDASGHFETFVPKRFAVAMSVMADNFAGKQQTIPADSGDLGEIRLQTGTEVFGQVLDQHDQPVAGVCVNISQTEVLEVQAGSRDMQYRLIRHTEKTDENGRYRLPPFRGSCQISVATAGNDREGNVLAGDRLAPIIKPQLIDLNGSGDLEHNLRECETVSLRGKVSWPDNSPASNIVVMARLRQDNLPGIMIGGDTSNSAGEYGIQVPTVSGDEQITLIVNGSSHLGTGEYHDAWPDDKVDAFSKSKRILTLVEIDKDIGEIDWELRPPSGRAPPIAARFVSEADEKLTEFSKRYYRQNTEFQKQIKDVTGEEEYIGIVTEYSPHELLVDAVLALEEKYRGTQTATNILSHVIGWRDCYGNFDGCGPADSRLAQGRETALKRIEQHYLQHPEADRFVAVLASRFMDAKYQQLLKRFQTESHHDHVRAAALFQEYQQLANLLMARESIEGRTTKIENWPAAHLEYVRNADVESVSERFHELGELILSAYSQVTQRTWMIREIGSMVCEISESLGNQVRYAEKVASILFEVERLRPGQPVPEVRGIDGNGDHFQLSELKGKVVVLYFTAKWFYDEDDRNRLNVSRELKEKFAGQPFEVVSISGDKEIEILKQAVDDGEITWQTVWDGMNGPIATRWNSNSFPSETYLIDHNGIIKARFSHGIDITDHVEALLKQIDAG